MKWLATAGSLVDTGVITWEIEADSASEAEDRAYNLARLSSVADSGDVTVEPLEEDKQLICDKLLDVFGLTRNLHDVIELKYDREKETVTAYFESGCSKTVNVAADSGTAMVTDIIHQIV